MKLIWPAVLSCLAALPATVRGGCEGDALAGFTGTPLPLGFDGENAGFVYPRDNCGTGITCLVVFKTDETIEFDDGNKNTLSVKIDDFYGGQAANFTNLCEELWACTDYTTQYGAKIAPPGNDVNSERYELCFGDPFDLSIDGAGDILKSLNGFIVTTCHGTEDLDAAARLEELQVKRDSSCAAAEDYARRLTFDLSDEDNLESDLKSALTALDQDVVADDLCGVENLNCTSDLDACDCSLNADLCVQIYNCARDQSTSLFGDGVIKLPGIGNLDTAGLPNFASSALDDVLGIEIDISEFIDDLLPATGKRVNAYDYCWNVAQADLIRTRDAICDDGTGSSCSSYEWTEGNGGCRSVPFCPENIAPLFADYGPAYPTADNPSYQVLIASIRNTFLCDPDVFYDRTSADAYALIAILKASFETLLVPAELLKDSLPDKIYWAWKVLPYIALATIINSFDTVLRQADYHDGLIDGAEIEAIYENTRQLLDGSAAIYDEVVCRCVDGLVLEAGNIVAPVLRGMGCNGQDDDCDQVIDDCSEDLWAPEFDVRTALATCSGWFKTQNEAEECVLAGTSVVDDCDPGVAGATPDASVVSSCGSSTVTLSVADRCGNTASVVVPVKIDETVPEVKCFFGDDEMTKQITFVEQTSATWAQTNLKYSVSDNCGQELEVPVKVFSQEDYAFQANLQAILYQDGDPLGRASLQVSTDVCNKNQNSESNPHNGFGQCIKDPGVDDRVRIYTVRVEAEDLAGNEASDECTILILPQVLNRKGVDIPDGLQRFLQAEYISAFTSA